MRVRSGGTTHTMTHPLGPPDGTTWHDLKNWSVASLIAANLIPLFGTLFLSWTSGDVLIVYWVETAVIGFYAILKMPVAWGWFSLFSVPFFIAHFGVFLSIAGRLAIGAYVLVDDVPGQRWATLDPIRGELSVFAALMLASHGVSFVTNFIGKKEYRLLKKDPEQLMVAPYRRVFVMMASVVVGAVLVSVTEAPSALMSIFIVLKIVADVIAHLNEHDMIRRGGEMVQGAGEPSPRPGEA